MKVAKWLLPRLTFMCYRLKTYGYPIDTYPLPIFSTPPTPTLDKFVMKKSCFTVQGHFQEGHPIQIQ